MDLLVLVARAAILLGTALMGAIWIRTAQVVNTAMDPLAEEDVVMTSNAVTEIIATDLLTVARAAAIMIGNVLRVRPVLITHVNQL